jgi:hypothetical protein
MADLRTDDELRAEVVHEREALASAVEGLRHELDEAKDIKRYVRARLPLVLGTAGALGFVRAGGLGTLARLLIPSRRGRRR